jgi:hypothetical protein
VVGFNLLSVVQTTYSGFFFVTLKPWSERTRPEEQYAAIRDHLNRELGKISAGNAFSFPPPSIPGIGTSGGFTFILEDRAGQGIQTLANQTQTFLAAARKRPEIASISTTLLPDVPQDFVQVDRDKVLAQIPRQLQFVDYAPVLRISALTGRGVNRVFEAIDTVYASYVRQIKTSELNKLLTELRQFGHTVTKGPRQLRLNYATQTRVKPPGFVFFANHPKLADENFKRYIENRMRERFDFEGSPIILKFRQKD